MAETGGDKAKQDGEEIAFTGYLSVWKLLGNTAFVVLLLLVFIFGNDTGAGHRNLFFLPGMLLFRIMAVGIISFWLVLCLRLLVKAAMNKPAIRVQDGIINVNYRKVGTFPISEVDEVGVVADEVYFIRVKTKKYGVVPMFCRDGKALRQNMEKLRLVVLGRAGSS